MTIKRKANAVPVWGVLSLLLISVSVAKNQTPAAPHLEIGQPFPELSFPQLGKPGLARMSALRGKKTILFVFASW